MSLRNSFSSFQLKFIPYKLVHSNPNHNGNDCSYLILYPTRVCNDFYEASLCIYSTALLTRSLDTIFLDSYCAPYCLKQSTTK